jgi:hypothetical protein
VNLFAARHIAVRPQVDVFIVARDSQQYAVYTASVSDRISLREPSDHTAALGRASPVYGPFADTRR